MALTATFIVVPHHQAFAGRGQCGAGQLCVWEHDDYKGCFAVLPEKDGDYTNGTPVWQDCPGVTVNDKVSSYVNNTDRWALFYTESKWRGLAVCMGPGADSPDLKNHGSWFGGSPEDKFSSHWLYDKGQEPDHFAFDEGPCGHKDWR